MGCLRQGGCGNRRVGNGHPRACASRRSRRFYYDADWLVRLLHNRIRIWSGALPNLIADFPIVPEYFNQSIRPGALTRWVERLSGPTAQRASMLDGYALVQQRMATSRPPGELGAEIVLSYLQNRKPGHL